MKIGNFLNIDFFPEGFFKFITFPINILDFLRKLINSMSDYKVEMVNIDNILKNMK